MVILGLGFVSRHYSLQQELDLLVWLARYCLTEIFVKQERICSGNMICSKIINFDHTEAGLTSKWGRILQAVQW